MNSTSDTEQANAMLLQFIRARRETPWVASVMEDLAEKCDDWMGPRRCIQRLGGMAEIWPRRWESQFSWERDA